MQNRVIRLYDKKKLKQQKRRQLVQMSRHTVFEVLQQHRCNNLIKQRHFFNRSRSFLNLVARIWLQHGWRLAANNVVARKQNNKLLDYKFTESRCDLKLVSHTNSVFKDVFRSYNNKTTKHSCSVNSKPSLVIKYESVTT